MKSPPINWESSTLQAAEPPVERESFDVDAFKRELALSIKEFNTKIELPQLDTFKRLARMWAVKKGTLVSEVTKSFNKIFMFRFGESRAVDPYFCWKVGRNGDPSQGRYETFIWETAKIFGVEEYFVPTTILSIPTDKCLVYYQEKGGYYRFPKHLKTIEGSFKYFQKGLLLNDYFEVKSPKPKIEFQKIIRAIVISMVFGMFDAHCNNIMITPDGGIVFFDVTRSFPHSNGVIKHGTDLMISYRCGLIEMNECYQEMSPEDKKYLRDVIDELKHRVPAFIKYLQLPEVKEGLGKLTPGWFHHHNAVSALRRRIRKLERAAYHEKFVTLADLPCLALREFSFFGILGIIDRIFHKEIAIPTTSDFQELNYFHQKAMENILFMRPRSAIKRLSCMGINPYLLRKFCNSKNNSFRELPEFILKSLQHQPICPGLVDYTFLAIGRRGRYDLKDLPREEVEFFASDYFNSAIRERRMEVILIKSTDSFDIEELACDLQIGSSYIIRIEGEFGDTFFLLKKKLDGGLLFAELDLSEPGYVSFSYMDDTALMDLQKFCDWAFPAFYCPELMNDDIDAFFSDLPNMSWILWFDSQLKQLAATSIDESRQLQTEWFDPEIIKSSADLMQIQVKYNKMGYTAFLRSNFLI